MRSSNHTVLKYHLTEAVAARFWAKVDKSAGPDACWPWTASLHGHGYGRFKLESYVQVGSNRMAYALHHKADPGPLCVCHSCDNRPCCNPAHLWLGTNDDNMADMAAKGRSKTPPSKGAQNGNAKLSEAQIETVKAMIRAGKTNIEIARPFGVTHQLISRIRRGRAWGSEPMTTRYASLKR